VKRGVDYWCNAFTPDRRPLWDAAIAAQGIPLRVRRESEDAFAEPGALLARLEASGFATLVVPTCEKPAHAGAIDFESIAARPGELRARAAAHPGRIAGQWSLDPGHGMAGVRAARAALAEPWCVGLHIHTHSWDRPLDHADYYPYYALAAEHDVPVVMQAGTSGGRMPSECGRPIGIDRPAIYFPEVRFVLSHTGWPWVEEALAMAIKFSNVYLGTATYPPARWGAALLDFARGPGRSKLLFGTGFPVVGHAQAAGQLAKLGLDAALLQRIVSDNARAVFTRLA
jgi:predicted TIM-barrel fold metal-dependent hydrolase